LEWYGKAASQGNAIAQYSLAKIYEEGHAVPKDSAQVVDLYRRAAEQGHSQARQRLRTMFIRGLLVPVDDAGSGRWWKNLVAQANAEAQAFLRLSIAAEKDVNLQVKLGIAYLTGVGTPKDREKATTSLRRAAELGHSEARCMLGAILGANSEWTPDHSKRAAELCRQAADEGFAHAQAILATFYGSGRGVGKDDALAAAWCRKAAEQGFRDAQSMLGFMFERGQGVPQDDVQANFWYRKAADQGDATAFLTLGLSTSVGQAGGKRGPFDEAADEQAMIDFNNEHRADGERALLGNLWASPAHQAKVRQLARELGASNQVQQEIDEINGARKTISPQ
jgi:TPR repeat protein